MGESFDIQSLLQTGYFTTSRAKSPKPQSSSQFEDRPSSQPPPLQQPPYQLPYQPLIPRPRSAAPARVPKVRPPPPSVEDEEISLKREHGACLSQNQEGEPPSRGDVEQNPMIMEVHEYNPERRFVILTGSSSGSEGGETERRGGADRRREPEKRTEADQRNEPGRRPEPERRHEPERRNEPERRAEPERRHEPERRTEPKPPRVERFDKPDRSERVERQERPLSDAYTETRPSRKYDTNLKTDIPTTRERSRPPLEKRRSRQELPRLETELRDDQLPEKYRSRPSASTNSRYDQPPARPPKIPIDPQLAPEVIKSSASGRDQAYYGQSQSAGRKSPVRPSHVSNMPTERRYESGHTRNSSTASNSKRTTVEPEKSTRPLSKERIGETSARPLSKERIDEEPARPLSKERVGETPYRSEYASRSGKKERSPTYGRPEREDYGRSSTFPMREPVREPVREPIREPIREPTVRREDRRDDRREGRDDRGDDSRSGDDHPKGPRELNPRRKKSVILQDERDSQSKLEKIDAPSGPRLRPRGPTIPIPVPIPMGSNASDDFPPNIRPASTFPITRDEHVLPERPKSQLPYPVDDDTLIDPFDVRGNVERIGRPRSRYEPDPVISMPEMPTPIAIGPETPLEARTTSAIPQDVRPIPPAHSWKPPTFDPNRDGVRLEKPMGSVRRHSEHQEATGVTTFPECRRKHPVAGLVDWLTLPRTDFNICPDCYGAVFSKTEYRKPFQPMLRPTAQAIACDFGVGPWYRIAWLLTLKNDLRDLRLFHEVANAISTTRSIPCPGDRVTTRNWLTLWNPQTRQPVYDFTICPQCVKIIQALFPNLTGIFIPLDSRSEPTRGLCAMRFKPKRKRFVMYFDAMETTSDQARLEQEEPDLLTLAQEVEKMVAVSECQEDKPIANGYWHIMQYLRQFSVCGECFDEVVKPLIKDDNVIARNFYMKPQKLPLATCQLYSNRMREIFRKAVRWNDPKYLEAKVIERMDVEAMIHEKLAKLERSKHEDEDWVEEQVDKYIQEWKRWE
ncbi:related to ser/arg-related nuclear matrix protein [Fusarium torulosum]|uniref:Related to ser/arg-related nuclear matrix protein n=1 Tax=Fusarium torulosum TaxID=33205 RepID=A0AAE8MG59_9HYPO|nr:related to ser/arg-related nuclear matrix protein [Fusarium torulosum]